MQAGHQGGVHQGDQPGAQGGVPQGAKGGLRAGRQTIKHLNTYLITIYNFLQRFQIKNAKLCQNKSAPKCPKLSQQLHVKMCQERFVKKRLC